MAKYFCNPLNVEYKYQFCIERGKKAISREAADPSLILFKDQYYLFPSMTAGFFTSEDLAAWEFHKFQQKMPIHDYAPDVRVIGEYLYFCASKRDADCSYFRTKDPIYGIFEEIEGTFLFWDPNLFQDDDGRIYFYWGCSNVTPVYGVELNPEDMKPLSESIVMLKESQKDTRYERNGEDHVPPKTPEQIEAMVQGMLKNMSGASEAQKEMLYKYMGNDPYIEGAWMTKYQGRYYLQYSAPGTQYNVYADGVYVSDKPLGPFTLAKNNPYSYKPGGFMTGAGHGSTLEDKNGDWWHTSTMRISMNRDFERRLGLWQAGFDEDGELYCDQRFGDWPMSIERKPWEVPEWMLLSYQKSVTVSSGDGADFITDENCRTWWKAATPESGEWALVDLGKAYDVRGIQINFADDKIIEGMPDDVEVKEKTREMRYIDERKHVTRWKLTGSLDGENFFVIEDKAEADTDLPHDFIVKENGMQVRYVKLTIKEIPFNQQVCISGIRVFGKGEGELPQAVKGISIELISDLDALLRWEHDEAIGHNILWGYAPDKLYHSYMVFGKTDQKIGALIKGQPLYMRIDSFNEVGISEGEIHTVICE